MNYIVTVQLDDLLTFALVHGELINIKNCWQKPLTVNGEYLFFPILSKDQAEKLAKNYHVSEQ